VRQLSVEKCILLNALVACETPVSFGEILLLESLWVKRKWLFLGKISVFKSTTDLSASGIGTSVMGAGATIFAVAILNLDVRYLDGRA